MPPSGSLCVWRPRNADAELARGPRAELTDT
jgi:hypothetical protein